MILFREYGRLGNQIFQYAALRTLCKDNEKLILLGFEDFQSVFSGVNARLVNRNSPRFEKSLYYRFYNRLDILSRAHIIARIKEYDMPGEQPEIIYSSALFDGIKFVDTSFFQYESAFDKQVISKLTIKEDLLVFAKDFLNTVYPCTPVFVHIRRGDYLSWPTAQNPAILPASYYHSCLNTIKSLIAKPFFIFLSDDPYYVKDIFPDLEDSFISKFSSSQDFVIMTQCQAGILSASSFSWWAAYFASLQYSNSTFLAPKYWAGHRSRKWYPPLIQSSFLTYVDV